MYCDAPTTVARMPSIEFLDARAERLDAGADFGGQQRAEIAEFLRLVAVDELRHAAGELDLRDRLAMS